MKPTIVRATAAEKLGEGAIRASAQDGERARNTREARECGVRVLGDEESVDDRNGALNPSDETVLFWSSKVQFASTPQSAGISTPSGSRVNGCVLVDCGSAALFDTPTGVSSTIAYYKSLEQAHVEKTEDQEQVLVLGKRVGWPSTAMPPHNLPFVMLGAGILWFGWFGFNGGSAFAADGVAAQAVLNTFVAGAAGMIAWLLIERIRDGHATTLGGASGVVAGLVAITPAAGFVGGLSPIIFGALASVCCYYAIQLKTRYGYDDSLDVVGIHMVGGIVGGLLLGFFADASIGGVDGAFFGDAALVVSQLIAIVSVIAFSFVVTFAIAKVLDNVIGIRVSDDDEVAGLDQTQHAETAYVD